MAMLAYLLKLFATTVCPATLFVAVGTGLLQGASLLLALFWGWTSVQGFLLITLYHSLHSIKLALLHGQWGLRCLMYHAYRHWVCFKGSGSPDQCTLLC